MLNYWITQHRKCLPFTLTHALKCMWYCITAVSITCWSSHIDVTLMQTLHDKGSTGYVNCDSTSHSIFSRYGLDIFVLINCILAKICYWKLGVPLIIKRYVFYDPDHGSHGHRSRKHKKSKKTKKRHTDRSVIAVSFVLV